jgi:hypothetical protein
MSYEYFSNMIRENKIMNQNIINANESYFS